MADIFWSCGPISWGSAQGFVQMFAQNVNDPDDINLAIDEEFARRRIIRTSDMNLVVCGIHNKRADYEAVFGVQSPWVSFSDYTPPHALRKTNWRREVLVHDGKVWPAP